MKFDYNFELENLLNNIYKHKIYNIAHKNNISYINKENFDTCIDVFKNTKIYLGSDMNEFIINLLPKEKDGYLFRCEIAKFHNYSFPRLYDYAGNKLTNINLNKFALQIWAAHMDELLIEDIHLKFNQDAFTTFVEDNLGSFAEDIISYVKNLNKTKSITIPFENIEDLISVVKSMILNKELNFSWAELLVDIDSLRNEMTKFATPFHMYNEFDKLEDDLEYCLNNFCKYDSNTLFDFLINEKNFNIVNNELVLN